MAKVKFMLEITFEVVDPKTGEKKKKKRYEPWTGLFDNEEQADKWFAVHGKYWEERGRKLIKVVGANIKEESNELEESTTQG